MDCDCNKPKPPTEIYISYAMLVHELQCDAERKQAKTDALGDACVRELEAIAGRRAR